jgi:hypothetical protein
MSSCTPAAKKVLDAIMAEKGNNRCIDCGSKLSVTPPPSLFYVSKGGEPVRPGQTHHRLALPCRAGVAAGGVAMT